MTRPAARLKHLAQYKPKIAVEARLTQFEWGSFTWQLVRRLHFRVEQLGVSFDTAAAARADARRVALELNLRIRRWV